MANYPEYTLQNGCYVYSVDQLIDKNKMLGTSIKRNKIMPEKWNNMNYY